MFSFQVELSKTIRFDNILGESMAKLINLLKCVCHASLSFIDTLNNPIINKVLCLIRVNLFDTCGDVTPSVY